MPMAYRVCSLDAEKYTQQCVGLSSYRQNVTSGHANIAVLLKLWLLWLLEAQAMSGGRPWIGFPGKDKRDKRHLGRRTCFRTEFELNFCLFFLWVRMFNCSLTEAIKNNNIVKDRKPLLLGYAIKKEMWGMRRRCWAGWLSSGLKQCQQSHQCNQGLEPHILVRIDSFISLCSW